MRQSSRVPKIDNFNNAGHIVHFIMNQVRFLEDNFPNLPARRLEAF